MAEPLNLPEPMLAVAVAKCGFDALAHADHLS
jgi:hypothetical protein